jgi:DNA-binding NarL/FixJ family response regulator
MRAVSLRLVTAPTVRVLVCERQALVRAALRALLDRDPGISVVAATGTGSEAIALADRLGTDVVLLDVAVGGLDAAETTERICEGGPAVLLLVGSEEDDRIVSALRAGASGTVLRDADPDELVRAVERADRGDLLLTPGLTRRLISALGKLPEPGMPTPERLEELTAREREVMALAARGLTNSEISEQLNVSPATAKTHISRAMVKLGARDRAQLVALAYESGLVPARN